MKYIEKDGGRGRYRSGEQGIDKNEERGDRSVMKLDKIRRERLVCSNREREYTIHDRFSYLVQLDN